MQLIDLGIAIVLITLAIFLLWRLADFFKKAGRRAEELAEEGLDKPPPPPPPLTAPLHPTTTDKEVGS